LLAHDQIRGQAGCIAGENGALEDSGFALPAFLLLGRVAGNTPGFREAPRLIGAPRDADLQPGDARSAGRP
jgi:hypothetical protein